LTFGTSGIGFSLSETQSQVRALLRAGRAETNAHSRALGAVEGVRVKVMGWHSLSIAGVNRGEPSRGFGQSRLMVLRARWVWLFCRLLWLLALVSHTVWFVGRCREGSASAIPLGLSMALFALKAADVSYLRKRWPRRSLVAAVVIVVFMHANVISDMLPDEASMSALWLSIETPIAVILRQVLYTLVVALLGLAVWSSCFRLRHAAVGYCVSAVSALAGARVTRVVCDSPLRAPPAQAIP